MAASDFPVLRRGVQFNLYVGNGATPEVFAAVCIGTTVAFDRKIITESAMVVDCANPTGLAQRQSVPTGVTVDLAFSGKCDFKKFQAIEAIFDSAVDVNWQAVREVTGAQGGGIHQGAGLLNELSLSKKDNGMVEFSAKIEGSGHWAWTAAA